jgi:hypothetical protein
MSDAGSASATAPLRHGGCLCGAVRFEVSGEPVGVAVCHCRSCRHGAGAQAVGWAMFPSAQVRYPAAAPQRYESSPGTWRGFCGRCGTSLNFESEQIPGLVDLTVGSFDDSDTLPPRVQIWCSHRLDWVAEAGSLPEFAEFPPAP